MNAKESHISLKVRPETLVPGGVALSQDAEGFVRSLFLGERFCGFSTKDHLPSDAAEIEVLRSGYQEIFVDRVADAVAGACVFATGPRSFTTMEQNGAREIGRILKITGARRAIVEFSV